MKKILALGLCICMTAAVSACGSGQGQTAAGTVPAQAAVEKTAEAGRPGPRMETRREQEPQGKPERGTAAPRKWMHRSRRSRCWYI